MGTAYGSGPCKTFDAGEPANSLWMTADTETLVVPVECGVGSPASKPLPQVMLVLAGSSLGSRRLDSRPPHCY